jgi:PAS domain S-box-containing protein
MTDSNRPPTGPVDGADLEDSVDLEPDAPRRNTVLGTAPMAGAGSDLPHGDMLDAVISSLATGIITADTAGQITHVNRAACEILGRAHEGLVGRALPSLRGELEAFMWPSDKGEILLMASGRPGELQFGDSRILGFSSRVVSDTAGNPSGVVVSFSDITVAKSKARAEAHSQRLADIGKVVATIAHEIRNPVFAIASLAQVLATEPAIAGDTELGEIVDKILEEARRISRLVDDLLIFGRDRPLEKQRVVTVDLVATLIADLERGLLAMEATGLPVPVRQHVTADTRDDSVWDVDPEALRRVLSNLIRNSWHAVAARSSERSPHDGIDVRMSRGADWLEIAVQDRGVGIPADKLEQVFETFYSMRHNGTGLGLAIAQRLISQHRGTITLESRLGEGTTVTVRLPA